MSNELPTEEARLDSLYRALDEPISEVDGFTPEQVTFYLREHGIEPARLQEALTTRISELERRLQPQQVRSENRTMAKRIARIGTNVASTIGEAKETALQRLNGLQLAKPQVAAAMLNKLEQADDSDIRALYEDLEHINELSDIPREG